MGLRGEINPPRPFTPDERSPRPFTRGDVSTAAVKHSVAGSLFRRSQSGDTMWKVVIPPAASALRGEIYSPRPFTPDERSPRPFTPDERSPRPFMPDERSPRPFTPNERSPRPLFRGDVSTAAVKHSVANSLFRRSQSGDTMWKAAIPPAASALRGEIYSPRPF